jgi:hypothetical protein
MFLIAFDTVYQFMYRSFEAVQAVRNGAVHGSL